jgi:hypothetical protein
MLLNKVINKRLDYVLNRFESIERDSSQREIGDFSFE